MQQHTIKQDACLEGIGLHSAKQVRVVLKAAPIDSGIIFRRLDHTPIVSIKTAPEKIQETSMCTVLSEGEVKIATIEHLMAALAILQIDNLYVDVYGEEIPVMDGSSAPFIFAIKSSGIKKQKALRRYLSIKKPVKLVDKDAFVEFIPSQNQQSYELSIDFDHPIIANSAQTLKMKFDTQILVRELSRARTFGFVEDLDRLKANNLALGASLDNAVGLTKDTVLNPGGLRYKDEFVRHKLLDAIGDLYVLGPIEGKFRAHKSGHKLNNLLLRKLLDTKDAWDFVS